MCATAEYEEVVKLGAAGAFSGDTPSLAQEGPSEKHILTPKWISDPHFMPDGKLTSVSSIDVKSNVVDKEPPKKKSLFALRMEKSRADAKKNSDCTLVNDVKGTSSNKFGGLLMSFILHSFPF